METMSYWLVSSLWFLKWVGGYLLIAFIFGYVRDLVQSRDTNQIPPEVIGLGWPIVIIAFVCVAIFLGVSSLARRVVWGIDGVVAHATRQLVHTDECGELYRHVGRGGSRLVVKVSDGTGEYWIPVPPDLRTARAAVAWSYRMNPTEYNPVVRA